MSGQMTALRFIFAPDPVGGDVQWLDWDPAGGCFVGGSFYEEGFFISSDGSPLRVLGGFTDILLMTEEDFQKAEVICPECYKEGHPGAAVGNYLVLTGGPNGDDVLLSPTTITSVQEVADE